MTVNEILQKISEGRTDLVFDLLQQSNWRDALSTGGVSPIRWFVYYNDVTALRAIEAAAGSLVGIDLNEELNSAAFFGHWKVCDFLISRGGDPQAALADTGETPLHSALCKAGRPYFAYTVRLLLERGADPNVFTIPDRETSAFMRDVRTKGETPLHRAAAFADPDIIEMLLAHGAKKDVRDAFGDTPLTWASWHLRPGRVLQLLAFPPHNITDRHVAMSTSDHGFGWGESMERKFVGEYAPLS